MIGWILLLLVLSALFYYYLVKPLNYWKERGVPQGKPMLIFGDNWGTALRKLSFAEMVQYIYNIVPERRYLGCYQFYVPTLVLKNPDLIKQITVKDFDHFVDHRTFISADIDPLWGKNLFALTGQKWREMRATLSPSFTSSKMKYMFTLMTDTAENLIKHFKDQNEDKITLEMKDTFTRYTNDVIATTAFGIKVDSLNHKTNEFYVMGKEATDFTSLWKNIKFMGYFLIPSVYKYLKVSLFSKNVNTFFRGLIDETIDTREKNNIVRNDMINLLMEARKGVSTVEETNSIIDTGYATVEESEIGKAKVQNELTNEDITAQALIFFFAGFDTVANLMCFLTYELAVNQEIQDKLRKEIQETLIQDNGKLTYEGLMKMKYLDMVVSETLRKWPSAVAVDRVCTKPYTIEPKTPDENPVHLTYNDVLWIPIFAIHRDPNNYPDPEKFDPERFNDENKKNIKPYTYLPFGVGPRNCIGSRFAILETKVVIFHILNNFKIVPVKETQIPLKLSKKSFALIGEKGNWLGLEQL